MRLRPNPRKKLAKKARFDGIAMQSFRIPENLRSFHRSQTMNRRLWQAQSLRYLLGSQLQNGMPFRAKFLGRNSYASMADPSSCFGA